MKMYIEYGIKETRFVVILKIKSLCGRRGAININK